MLTIESRPYLNALLRYILAEWDGKPFASSTRMQSMWAQPGEKAICDALDEAGLEIEFSKLPDLMVPLIKHRLPFYDAEKVALFCGSVHADQLLIAD